ncbi:MAG: RNA 2',3'-cyclic phosphodiesterase [bacterium]|nr:RNA 2',3'-cyclic phosphodiesterase [bacterium]
MRLFLAIPLPDATQKVIGNLLSALRELPGARGSFPKPTNLHLTVYFLGDHPESALPIIKSTITNALLNQSVLPDLLMEQIGAFPNLRNPRALFLGGIADPALLEFVTTVRNACSVAAIHGDAKTFLPHITLMRIKEISDMKMWQERVMRIRFVPQSIPIRELVLYKSDLGEHGPTYTPILNWRIG